jgi:CheY-like chemotaxis protein
LRFQPPARLSFEIRDTGIGIAEKDVQKLFQPFAQVGNTQRRLGGTGLGLAISSQFVHLMGGDIEVESRAGHGSVFRFSIAVETAKGPAAAAFGNRITGYVGGRRRVLVVDDIEENRAVLREMLGQLGFGVSEAEGGLEALERIESQRPDLILMDMVMPNVDGLEAIRRLRQRPECAALPVIVVSASASISDEKLAFAAGAVT